MTLAARDESQWCRAFSLEHSATILEASAHRFGISRVGRITQLDGIGIETVSAIRRDPVGESISVCTGKGPTELHARVGALSEALERYCAEPRDRIPVAVARAAELTQASLPPELFALPLAANSEGLIEWCTGSTLEGNSILVPANAVFFPYIPSAGVEKLFAAHTTGLATGASVEEALVFALLECIERDAYSRAVALATIGRGHEVPVVDPDAALDAAPQEFNAVRARHHDIQIRDLTCDTDVPCYLCTIYDGLLAHFGVAACPDATEALRKAIQEAAQSRLTDLQGAREDLTERHSQPQVDPWFTHQGDASMVTLRSGWTSHSAAEALAGLYTRLRALTHGSEVAWVDLSLTGVNLSVVRAITPGLDVWAFDPTRFGARAKQWLRL